MDRTKEFHINVFWSEEDEACIADTPDRKHCSSHGATVEATRQEVLTSKVVWREAAAVDNESVPRPRYHPVISHSAKPEAYHPH